MQTDFEAAISFIDSFSVLDVLRSSFELLRNRPGTVLLLSLTGFVPLMVADVLIGSLVSAEPDPSKALLLAGAVGGFMADAIAATLTLAPITYGIVQGWRRESFTISAALSASADHLLPLIGVGLCSGLIVAAGVALLAAPGLAVLSMSAVAAPNCFVERRGILDSFPRSAELTSGRRWRVLGLALATSIVPWTASAALVLARPGRGWDDLSLLAGAMLLAGVHLVAGAFRAVTLSLLYIHLRITREGMDFRQVDEVLNSPRP